MKEIIRKSTELINYEIKTFGFSVISPSDHNFRELISIKKRFSSQEFKALNNKTKIFGPSELLKYENKDLSEYNNFCKEVIKILNFEDLDLDLDSIYQTYDNKESRHIAQQPHLDRIPTLKFMLYVNNLKFDNGAFCLSPSSNHWTRETFKNNRKSFYNKDFLESTRNIPKPILDRMIPIEGEAGTIIIFNTDCVHHQGFVKSGEACIIRSHYRQKHPSKNFFSRKKQLIKNFLKNLFK